jgi:SSS family solute:Na+ symporter
MKSISLSTGLSALFFFVYVFIAIIIGIYASKKETEEDFMIANRRVHGVLMISTITAGMFDGAVLSIYIAYVYQYGFSAIWFFLGMSFGFLLFRYFSKRIKEKADELNVYSMPEFFFKVLGKKSGIMFSIFLIIQFFGYLIVNFILSGKVFAAIFPISYSISVIVGGVIILSYLLLAGFKAVVRTDFFQLIIMIIMTLTVSIFLLGRAKLHGITYGYGTMGLADIVGFFVLSGFGILVAPDLWQRVFAAKDIKTLKSGFMFGAILLPILALIITVVGLSTKYRYPNINPEDALITGFAMLLPFVLREFGTVLLYAVALSSSDTVTFVVSSIFTRDLKNYSTKYSRESMVKMTRFFMVSFVIIAIIIAIFYQKILTLAFSLASLNLALFPAVFGSLFWKLQDRAVYISLVIVLASILLLTVTSSLTPATAALSLPIAAITLVIFQLIFQHKN